MRSIRTQTSKVLNRIHAPLPRSRRAVSCSPFTRYGYDSSEREFYENIRGKPTVQDDIFTMSRYAEPAKRYTGMFNSYVYKPGYYLNKYRDILFPKGTEEGRRTRFFGKPVHTNERLYTKYHMNSAWMIAPSLW